MDFPIIIGTPPCLHFFQTLEVGTVQREEQRHKDGRGRIGEDEVELWATRSSNF
jgi:hypothetical protein